MDAPCAFPVLRRIKICHRDISFIYRFGLFAFAADAVAIEAMRVGRQDLEAAVGDVATVQIGWQLATGGAVVLGEVGMWDTSNLQVTAEYMRAMYDNGSTEK